MNNGRSQGSSGGGYGGYGGYYGNTSRNTPRPKKYVPPKKTGYAAIVMTDRTDPDFEEIKILSEYKMGEIFERGNFDHWKVTLSPKDEVWKYAHGKGYIPAIAMDINDIPHRITKNRTVACCAYNATNDYMQHWLGMKLDRDDREWYKLNDMCTKDGLQQQYTFTVLHQLIEPYGLGISRILVPRNTRRFEDYHPFIASLGCNPFFLVDGSTTNEEALEKMFPDESKRDEMREKMFSMWRFECADEPLKGAVTMRQFGMTSVGHNGGSNYFGPRSKMSADGWHMSIKMDRQELITYNKPLVLPKYREYPGSSTPDFWLIKDGDGKSLRQIETEINKENREKWSKSSITTTKSSGSQLTLVDPEPMDNNGDDQLLAYATICEVCQKSTGSHYVSGERACEWCGGEMEIDLVSRSMIGQGYVEVPDADFERLDDNDVAEATESDSLLKTL